MTYLLDFDRTIFNTAEMYRWAVNSGRVPNEFIPIVETTIAGRGDYTLPIWDKFFSAFERGDLDLVPEDAERFVFDDARDFLNMHGSEIVVVTYGRKAIQEKKVTRAKIEGMVRDVFYIGRRPKGEAIAEQFSAADAPLTFVDDSPLHLKSVQDLCPWVTPYEMQRSGKPGSGLCPLIHSFTELP